jgi:hypothetical protein
MIRGYENIDDGAPRNGNTLSRMKDEQKCLVGKKREKTEGKEIFREKLHFRLDVFCLESLNLT